MEPDRAVDAEYKEEPNGVTSEWRRMIHAQYISG